MKENRIRILIVEDEFITMQTLTSVLEEMDYVVSGDAMTADEAIKVLDKGETDLAILDINLKGKKDGIWLAGRIKEQYKIPFIFLTAFGDQATVRRAIDTEPYGYLVKPFNKVDIFTSIEVALKNYAKQDHSVSEEAETEEEAEPYIMATDSLFIRDHYMYVKLKINDIMFIKSDKNYLEIFLPGKKHLVRGKLKDFMENLPREKFIQVHRSHVVNIDLVDSFGAGDVNIQGFKIPLGTAHKDELKKRLKMF